MSYRPRRSVLYLPGSNLRAIAKARILDVDCIIFDLEDSVAPSKKIDARDQVATALSEGGFEDREVIVRVNANDSKWFADDIVCFAKLPGVDALLVPKLEKKQQLLQVRQILKSNGASADLAIWGMIETPVAVLDIASLVRNEDVEYKLSCLVLGTNDLAKETGAALSGDRQFVIGWLMQVLLAARANNLDCIDGVFNDFRNLDGFDKECRQGLGMGMDGKSLIHPSQIDMCNETFSPSTDAVSWSQKILDEFLKPENSNSSVVAIDGKMVERLHAVSAKRIVEVAKILDIRAKSRKGNP
ncbi:MAG: CoA ester lyase [Hyphomicrobiales bacterium]|nr:MAG: CoA ester lyase [Hyphomicrobiales bacterium]